MATLLQQKNCMKTLTNGTTVNSGSSTSGVTTNKTLLPHEMVGVPVAPMNTTPSLSSGQSANIHNLHHNHNNIHHNQSQTHFYQFNNSNLYNNINDNMYRSSSLLSASNCHNNTLSSSSVISYTNNSSIVTTAAISSIECNDNLQNSIIMTEEEIRNEEILNSNPNGINSETNVQNMEEEETENPPEIDIVINNVVCSFSVRCHLNLREIALNGFNVEFRRENGMVTMKLRHPYTTASIWSSGRITCTGATSEEQAKIAARRYARCLQKLGFSAKFNNFRVVNVLGTCSMPWAIKIVNFSEKYKKDASYEPELHPGVTYKLKTPKATLKIFSTGSVTVTAASVADVQTAIEHIFPLVYEFRKERPKVEPDTSKIVVEGKKRPFGKAENDPTEDIMDVSDQEELVDGGAISSDEEV